MLEDIMRKAEGMTVTEHDDFYCSDVSRDLNEAMAGTAPETRTWLLLEVNAEWRKHATTDNDLPPHVMAWLNAAQQILDQPRLVFIRQRQATRSLGQVSFYVAISSGLHPRLYRFHLDSYDELLSINLNALLEGKRSSQPHLDRGMLYLVCTNGKRDRACARDGVSYHQALSEVAGDRCWQASHIGGHRFAPTGVLLPYGIYLGRLDLLDPVTLTESVAKGQLPPQVYRGRASQRPEVQVAEALLGERLGYLYLQGLELRDFYFENENRWRVRFFHHGDRRVYGLEVLRSFDEGRVPTNSGQWEDSVALPRYRLIDYLVGR